MGETLVFSEIGLAVFLLYNIKKLQNCCKKMEELKMVNNYSKAYKEVIEILKFVPKESVEKIPQTMIDTFKTKMDKDYDFIVDINKSFEEQDLLDETKAILANIFRDYWATPYQKERIEAKERYDRQKMEEEKRTRYNVDIFKRNENTVEQEVTENTDKNNNLPIKAKKENFLKKIIIFFKKMFHINQEVIYMIDTQLMKV